MKPLHTHLQPGEQRGDLDELEWVAGALDGEQVGETCEEDISDQEQHRNDTGDDGSTGRGPLVELLQLWHANHEADKRGGEQGVDDRHNLGLDAVLVLELSWPEVDDVAVVVGAGHWGAAHLVVHVPAGHQGDEGAGSEGPDVPGSEDSGHGGGVLAAEVDDGEADKRGDDHGGPVAGLVDVVVGDADGHLEVSDELSGTGIGLLLWEVEQVVVVDGAVGCEEHESWDTLDAVELEDLRDGLGVLEVCLGEVQRLCRVVVGDTVGVVPDPGLGDGVEHGVELEASGAADTGLGAGEQGDDVEVAGTV